MKREFLESLQLEKDVIDQIMAEHGKTTEKSKTANEAMKQEVEALKTQISQANQQIEDFKSMDIDGVRAAAEQWKQKAEEAEQKSKELEYSFTVKEAAAGLKFTSEAAKRAFIGDLQEKKLPAENGKLLGVNDFIKAYQESDPGVFAPAEDTKTTLKTGMRQTGTEGAPDKKEEANEAFRLLFGKE